MSVAVIPSSDMYKNKQTSGRWKVRRCMCVCFVCQEKKEEL